jgi:UDP-N-acetyl-D-glucosamine dehydrogenase
VSRDALVGIIGLGYVGLPVAMAFAEAGFRVVGVDIDESKIEGLRAGRSYVSDVADQRIEPLLASELLRFSTTTRLLRDADAILISVPTPITDGVPDLSAVIDAGRSVANEMKAGSLVVLESTTYPGTTEEVLRPLLEESGLVAGKDFFLAFSPERIDPGNPRYRFEDIPKVVGGIDEASTKAAQGLYLQVLPKVFTVSGTREAELTKLIENTFRHVNIALVNELAVYAYEMGIDIWETIEAAASKPFGYMPFWPSPGWGGHCIPLDPSYLSWRVRRDRSHEVRFVELAQAVNSEMPRHVIERVAALLNDQGKAVRGSSILGVGMAYKGGTDDLRGSAGVRILSELERRGAEAAYHDPLVPRARIGDTDRTSVALDQSVEAADLVVIFVPQDGVDWALVEKGRAVLDCCNALGRRLPNVTRL